MCPGRGGGKHAAALGCGSGGGCHCVAVAVVPNVAGDCYEAAKHG